MAEADRISISNKAALGAGVNMIDSLIAPSTTEEIFCAEWYEEIVNSELSLYKWRFATTTFDLTPNILAAEPETKYNTAYQLPSGVTSVNTVLVNDEPINYDRHKTEIHTNDTSGDTVILVYRYRADESHWNPYFRLLIIYRLATMLSFSIARKEDLAGSMKNLADEHWKRAKTEDAQAQTNSKVNLQRIVRGRGGRLDKFWRQR